MSQNYSRRLVRALMLVGLVLGPSIVNPSQALSQLPQGVVTYGDWGPKQIYAFPPTHGVSVNSWDGSRWLWANHGTPPGGSHSASGVITYKDQLQPQRIYAFFNGGSDHLNVYYWDGALWHWADLGAPNATPEPWPGGSDAPAPITYRDPTGVRRIHVYVVNRGRLHSSVWDGSQWVWADHGRPPGTLARGVPAVTTYRAGANQQWIHAFVTGVDGHLYVNYWDGSQYRWADQGTPPGTTVAFGTSPGVVTFREGAEPQRIYAFVKGTNQRLYVNYWDGSQWRWQDQGVPSGTSSLYSSRCPFGAIQALTYKDVNQPQRIYAFIAGGGGCHLYVNYWDGWQWHWQDQGTPPGGIVGHLFGAVTFKDTYYDDGVQPRQIYVHVKRNSEQDDDWSNDHRYFVNHWDGYQWRWEETGGPP